MAEQNLTKAGEGWSMEILGIHFIEGTASSALIYFFAIFILFLSYYGIFKFLHLRWGLYKSLFITILLIHIIPVILLWTIKYALY